MQILYFVLNQIRDMPAWMRWVFVLLSFLTILGASAFITPMVGIMIGAGLVVVFGLVSLVQFLIKKRRDKKYPYMKHPRSVLRKRLLDQEVAA